MGKGWQWGYRNGKRVKKKVEGNTFNGDTPTVSYSGSCSQEQWDQIFGKKETDESPREETKEA